MPRSPSALLSRNEREKVFLEVHIQNLTQEPMWFERMLFEPAQGWRVDDANVFAAGALDADAMSVGGESLFSGPTGMMQPQDARQYLYILSATVLPTFAVQHSPGQVIPLGRLDITWRSSFGEPGRLLTSVSDYRSKTPHIFIERSTADALSTYSSSPYHSATTPTSVGPSLASPTLRHCPDPITGLTTSFAGEHAADRSCTIPSKFAI